MAAFKTELKAGLGELPKLHFGHIISSLFPHFTQSLAVRNHRRSIKTKGLYGSASPSIVAAAG